ncbi:Netrin receptor UNC5C [Trichinella spiralis]|uniref:Netrin receptor UNC5 n=1 Tax=Trichinella spiralis TaxID=6334 RepID=A0A0V1C2Y6_TRISP|nr:Netrin receptor UNC5C [Trichinella spiralis]
MNRQQPLILITAKPLLLALIVAPFRTMDDVDSATTSVADVQLPLKPILLQAPEDSYIVRGRQPHQQNALLTCKALYAERIKFKCNGIWIPETEYERREGIDSSSNTPFLQTSIIVNRHSVDRIRSFSGEYSCECIAYGTGPEDKAEQVKSMPAVVRVAYLSKDFYREPASERRPLNSLVELPCQPPEGDPSPEVFWMKDGVEIESRKDPNVIVANDGSLLISSARFSDSGNYTCGARNIAHERTTLPATLHIYVDGQWSTWGSWEGVCPTNCKAWINNRRRVSRLTRYRHCNNPPPANGGSQCSGSSKEQVDCELPCPVDGSWSEWSRWTDCQTNCNRVRRRFCDNPAPRYGGANCFGPEQQLRNCTDGLCTPGKLHRLSPLDADSMRQQGGTLFGNNVAMYAGLGAALFAFVFAIFFIFGVVLRRRTCHRCAKDYEPAPTQNPTNTIIRGTMPPEVSKLTAHTQLPFIFDTVPTTLNSDRSRQGSQKSDSSAFYYPNTSDENNYATVDDSRPDYGYYEDGISLASSNGTRCTATHLNGNKANGCGVLLKNQAVSVFIPEGALVADAEEEQQEERQIEVTVSVCDERPPLSDEQILLAPVVWLRCNGGVAPLKKPAVVSVEHSALIKVPFDASKDDWQISCLISEQIPYEASMADWNLEATVGKETLNTDVYCQVDSHCVHFLVAKFGKLALIGQPSRADVNLVKRVRLLAFLHSTCLRIHCVDDTRCALMRVVRHQRELGGRLCAINGGDALPLKLHADLCLSLESISSGWTVTAPVGHYQEIPSSRLCQSFAFDVHCSFSLESTISASQKIFQDNCCSSSLTAHLVIYQKDDYESAVHLKVDSNSWLNIEDHLRPFQPAVRLSQTVKAEICAMLDPPLESGNDWRMLAHLLGVAHYLPYFASRSSPSELILTLWESREQNCTAFVKLAHFLRKMRREDAYMALSNYLNTI